MSSKLTQVAITLAILAAFAVHQLEAISCWQCNSVNNEFCNQVPSGPVSNASKLPDCLRSLYKPCVSDDERLNYTFCRKQDQVVNGQSRTIRGCGYDKADLDCYMTKTPSVNTRVCQCMTDGCNGSHSVTLGLITILAAFAINRFLLH